MNSVQPNSITRRERLMGAAVMLALSPGALGARNGLGADQRAAEPNLIQQENAREGATDWQLTRVRVDKTDGCRSPGDRRLLLQAERGGGREAADHGLHGAGGEVPDRDLPHGLLRRTRGAADDHARPVRGQAAAHAHARRADHARVPLGTGRRADDPRRLAQRRLPGPAHHAAGQRTTSPTGRATWSSSSATTARPTSSSSAATTPGRPTTAGPTSSPSTRTPRAARARGPT